MAVCMAKFHLSELITCTVSRGEKGKRTTKKATYSCQFEIVVEKGGIISLLPPATSLVWCHFAPPPATSLVWCHTEYDRVITIFKTPKQV